MFCKSCGFDLGQQAPKYCPGCGALTAEGPVSSPAPEPENEMVQLETQALAVPMPATPPAPAIEPEGISLHVAEAIPEANPGPIPEVSAVAAEPSLEVEPVATAEVPPELVVPSKPPQVPGRTGVDRRLIIGGGALLLVLGGAWWFLTKTAPEPLTSESVSLAPAPAPASESAPASDSVPAQSQEVPATPAVQAPKKDISRETAKATPRPVAVKPRPKPEPEPKKEPTPQVSEATVPSGEANWLQMMRRDLDNCKGAFFCKEKVRWKYCNGRWNTVPECKVNG